MAATLPRYISTSFKFICSVITDQCIIFVQDWLDGGEFLPAWVHQHLGIPLAPYMKILKKKIISSNKWNTTIITQSTNLEIGFGWRGPTRDVAQRERHWERGWVPPLSNLWKPINHPGVIRQGDGRGPSAGGYLGWTPRFWSEAGGRSENCFYLAHTYPIAFGLWDDCDCSTPVYYICERTAPPAVLW